MMTSSPEGRQEAAVVPVEVKPLEWNGGIELADRQKVWAAIAEGMEFTYSIWGGGVEDDGRFFCAKVLPQHFDSLDEAKAAVQQNYDDRIRSALIPAKPAVEVVEALKVAREEIVIAIAFLGRDAGTSRIDRTIESLINRLVKTDQLAQAALSQNEGDRK